MEKSNKVVFTITRDVTRVLPLKLIGNNNRITKTPCDSFPQIYTDSFAMTSSSERVKEGTVRFLALQIIKLYIGASSSCSILTLNIHIQHPIWHFFTRNLNGDLQVTGVFKDVMEILIYRTKLLNFTLTAEYLGSYGKVTSPTNGTGFVGHVMRNECDVVLTPMPLNPESLQYMEFTVTGSERAFFIVSGLTEAYTSNIFAILNILEPEIWCCLLGLLLPFATLCHVMFGNASFRFNKPRGLNTDYSRTFLKSFAIILRQDIEITMISNADRIAWCFWSTGVFFITSAFSGVLLSVMTLPDAPQFVEELKDILKYPNMTIRLEPNIQFHYITKISFDTELENTWNYILKEKNVSLAGLNYKLKGDLPMDDIANGRQIAVWHDHIISNKLRTSGFCNNSKSNQVYMSKKAVTSMMMSIPFRRGLNPTFSNRFQDANARVFEGHIANRIFEMEIWKSERCLARPPTVEQNAKEIPLKLKNFALMFNQFHLGILLSCVALVVEIKNMFRESRI